MHWSSDTSIGGPNGRFLSTRPSLLQAMTGTVSSDALERVVALYWKPVYRFIRHKFGTDNEDAKDLTQRFFATTAIERDFFARYDPNRASFRTYLRMAVERFAANEHAASNRQKRGGDVVFEPMEENISTADSPEQAFERDCQRQVFALAVNDLRTSAKRRASGSTSGYLKHTISPEGERPSYAELAELHNIAETTVTNHLSWARRTLRMLVMERIRGVTASEREFREEMRRVWI
jgi:RNA polymerase sigma factor (sigma-70 family)